VGLVIKFGKQQGKMGQVTLGQEMSQKSQDFNETRQNK